jgi:tartrate-resistant acid phosphatase type 5
MLLLAITICALLCATVSANMDILVAGDWGGQPNKPYTTSEEVDTAKIMGDIASSSNAAMAWMLGDNFYDDGVKNVDDPRFKETFEDVFTADSLKNLPFWIVAGNHDHYGNAQAEVEYSSHSSRWTFPSLYYTQTWKVTGTNRTVQVVMIDTVELCGGSQDYDYCRRHDIADEDCVIQPTGPEDVKVAANQWQWINDTLEKSTADYLIVAGHYPVWSIAEHGPTKCLVENLRPALIHYKVNSYMCGHDHTFEEIVETDHTKLQYIVTGGAHYCDSSTSHKNNIPTNSLQFHGCDKGGFVRLHMSDDGMYFAYYYGSGTSVKHTTATLKPRN